MSQARTSSHNPWLVLVVLTAGFFMILLDTTIVNVAIPSMSSADKGLNATLDQRVRTRVRGAPDHRRPAR
jgi:hypothetical protein